MLLVSSPRYWNNYYTFSNGQCTLLFLQWILQLFLQLQVLEDLLQCPATSSLAFKSWFPDNIASV